MTANHSVDLFVYGLVVIVLNLVAHRIAPDFAGAILILLIVGGVILMLLGGLGQRGLQRRLWAVMTLTVVAALLLVQGARAWFAVKSGVDGMKPVAGIFTLLLFFGITQLKNLARTESHLHVKSKGSADSPPNGDGTKDEVQKLSHPRLDE